ncbi:MAG TPA: hypothetical protein VFA86_03175 [Gammaproteobacteria bacterium]|nr:hypothetical protein [Gammaproteobacteria bacterium]
MWQQSIVAVLVLASSAWLTWKLILPARLKRILSGGRANTAAGCHGCALAEAGCAAGAREPGPPRRPARTRRAGGPPARPRADGRGGY